MLFTAHAKSTTMNSLIPTLTKIQGFSHSGVFVHTPKTKTMT